MTEFYGVTLENLIGHLSVYIANQKLGMEG